MTTSIRSGVVLLAVAALAPAARAQSSRNDRVYAGYQLLYKGDQLGAIRHFQTLLKPAQDDLAFRYGLLTAQRERLNRDVPLRAEFEKGVDSLIDLADKRYGRTSRDEEALFYLAQA